MFSDESVHTRFAGVDAPHSGNSDQLIAVRYDGVAATWQYSDGALWHNFAHVSSDHLIAQVDFGDTSIYDLGGQLPWGRFVHERARAERDAWDGDDLNTLYDAWHENVRAAHTLYTLARGDAYYATAVDLADGARTFALDVADEVYDHVIGSSHDQRAFQLRLADAVARYRRETAEAEYEYERDHGLAILNDDDTARDAAEQARTDAKADAEETYQERYADIDRWRRQDLAGSSLKLARESAELFGDEAQSVATLEAAYDAAITAAYSGTGGLERTLADLARDYAHDEADELALQMSALSNVNSPSWGVWADWAEAQADLAEEHLLKPLADALHDQRVDEAVAYTTARDSSNEAGRANWLSDVSAEIDLSITTAAADAGAAGSMLSAEEIDVPVDVVVPEIETGVLSNVSSYAHSPNSLMAVPGGWYGGYFGSDWGWDPSGLYLFSPVGVLNAYYPPWTGGFLLDFADGSPVYYAAPDNPGSSFHWNSTLVLPINAHIPLAILSNEPDVDTEADVEDFDREVNDTTETVIDVVDALQESADQDPQVIDPAGPYGSVAQTAPRDVLNRAHSWKLNSTIDCHCAPRAGSNRDGLPAGAVRSADARARRCRVGPAGFGADTAR